MGQASNCISSHQPICTPSPAEEVKVVYTLSENEDLHDEVVAVSSPMLRRSQLLLIKSHLPFSSVYSSGALLGEGSCSRVFAATRVGGASPPAAAVKEFPPRHRRIFETERKALAGLEHPHIVRLFGTFLEEPNFRLVVELCCGGDLFSRIQRDRCIAETTAQRIFWQMVWAVAYLHCISILHQDLKTENWLLIDKGVDAALVKLCDFGTVSYLSPDRPREKRPMGTFSYKPPEAHNGLGVSIPGDVWALGVALYTMVVGADPFLKANDSEAAARERILSGSIAKQNPQWLALAPNCRELQDLLFALDEAQRPSCCRVLIHPWVVPGKPVLQCEAMDSEKDLLKVFIPEILRLMALFAYLHPLQQLLLLLCARIPSSLEPLDYGSRQDDDSKASESITTMLPWRALFAHLDADRDGKLGVGELRRGLSPHCGPELRTWLTVLDQDGSGAVDWIEWSALAMLQAGIMGQLADEAELMTALFHLLDNPTGDGKICERDLEVLLHPTETNKRHMLNKWIREWALEAPSAPPASSSSILNQEDLTRLLSMEELRSR